MRPLLHILVAIPLAYVAACIAAGLTAGFGSYDLFIGDPDFGMEGFVLGFGVVAGAYFVALAAAPAFFAIALAEIMRWRSFFYFVGAGGLIAFAASAWLGGAPALAVIDKSSVLVASGIVGGAVYWFIAGRRAGSFREAPRPEAETP